MSAAVPQSPLQRRKREGVLAATVVGVAVLVLVLMLLSLRAARAETPASAPAAPVGLDVGEVAPFAGLLLPETAAFEYAGVRASLEECRLKVDVRDRELARLLAAPPVAAVSPVKWTFWVGLGVGLVGGVVAGAAALLGGARLSAALGGS